jgi:hypothetical protein
LGSPAEISHYSAYRGRTPVISIENQTCTLFLEKKYDVDTYEQTPQRLDTNALDRNQSLRLIAGIARSLGNVTSRTALQDPSSDDTSKPSRNSEREQTMAVDFNPSSPREKPTLYSSETDQDDGDGAD